MSFEIHFSHTEPIILLSLLCNLFLSAATKRKFAKMCCRAKVKQTTQLRSYDVQTRTRSRTASCSMGTGVLSLSKQDGAWSWLLNFTQYEAKNEWRYNYIPLRVYICVLHCTHTNTHTHTHIYIYIYKHVGLCLYIYIQGVTGGMDQTSGECTLCWTIPI